MIRTAVTYPERKVTQNTTGLASTTVKQDFVRGARMNCMKTNQSNTSKWENSRKSIKAEETGKVQHLS